MTTLTEAELDEWGDQVRYLLAHTEGYLPHEETLERVLAAARAHLSAGWRPIETAPHSGRSITVVISGRKCELVDAPLFEDTP